MSTPESSDSYWEQIGGQVLGELDRRLRSGEAKDLPGTLLMRLAEQYLKWLDKQAEKAAQEESEYLTPLEAIDQEGLPVERKIEILQVYMDQLVADHKLAEEKLKELISGNAS